MNNTSKQWPPEPNHRRVGVSGIVLALYRWSLSTLHFLSYYSQYSGSHFISLSDDPSKWDASIHEHLTERAQRRPRPRERVRISNTTSSPVELKNVAGGGIASDEVGTELTLDDVEIEQLRLMVATHASLQAQTSMSAGSARGKGGLGEMINAAYPSSVRPRPYPARMIVQ